MTIPQDPGYSTGAPPPPPPPPPYAPAPIPPSFPQQSEANSKKLAAGLCGILLGGLGIHKFILGYNTAGIIMLLVTLAGSPFTCFAAYGVMHVIGLVEGILYLTKSDADFYNTYMANKKEWF